MRKSCIDEGDIESREEATRIALWTPQTDHTFEPKLLGKWWAQYVGPKSDATKVITLQNKSPLETTVCKGNGSYVNLEEI
jgi:hypothetical protein